MLYIAVVVSAGGKSRSARHDGSWASFISTSIDIACQNAIRAREEYQAKGSGPYEILVGRLKDRLELPTSYVLKSLIDKE